MCVVARKKVEIEYIAIAGAYDTFRSRYCLFHIIFRSKERARQFQNKKQKCLGIGNLKY